MSKDKVFTGFAKEKELKFGIITELSWTREQYDEMGKYFNEKGYLNVDLLKAASGQPYMQINTYGVTGGGAAAPIVQPSQENENALPF